MLTPFMEQGCSPEGPEDKVDSLDLLPDTPKTAWLQMGE